MHKALAATALAASLLATSVTAACAGDDGYYRDDHYHDSPGRFVGDVVKGVVRIATAPLALLAAIGRDGHDHDRYDYSEGVYAPTPEAAHDYYGADARFYGSPPRYDHRW